MRLREAGAPGFHRSPAWGTFTVSGRALLLGPPETQRQHVRSQFCDFQLGVTKCESAEEYEQVMWDCLF